MSSAAIAGIISQCHCFAASALRAFAISGAGRCGSCEANEREGLRAVLVQRIALRVAAQVHDRAKMVEQAQMFAPAHVDDREQHLFLDRAETLRTQQRRLLGVSLIVDAALGIINKAVPQMQIIQVGMPAKIVIGMLALGIGLPAMVAGVNTGVEFGLTILMRVIRGG